MRVWIDYQDDPDVPTVECEVDAVPRIGEKVGVRPILDADGEPVPDTFFLDYVVDVRHYLVPSEEVAAVLPERMRARQREVRVLTSSSR